MLSRRSVRIKVMQLLFALSRDEKLDLKTVLQRYDQLVDKSFEMFMFNLFIFIEVCSKSSEDKGKRSSKHLPEDFDKKFQDLLFTNDLIQSVVNDPAAIKFFKERDFASRLDSDLVLKIYKSFAKEDVYKAYVVSGEASHEDHKQILLDLFRVVRKNEHYLELVEDFNPIWYDDSSLIIGAMKKIIKALPIKNGDYETYKTDEETAGFGRELLKRTIENDKDFFDLIDPALKNWDAERLAILDMILLKMGLCEFTKFQTIPTKVTLNEYVEVSKIYSTPKSKDFINGILDRLLKQLDKEGKIVKEGRGLID